MKLVEEATRSVEIWKMDQSLFFPLCVFLFASKRSLPQQTDREQKDFDASNDPAASETVNFGKKNKIEQNGTRTRALSNVDYHMPMEGYLERRAITSSAICPSMWRSAGRSRKKNDNFPFVVGYPPSQVARGPSASVQCEQGLEHLVLHFPPTGVAKNDGARSLKFRLFLPACSEQGKEGEGWQL